MSRSNRALNRLFLAVVGLVTVGVGAALLATASAGGVGRVLRDALASTGDGLGDLLARTPLDPAGGTGGSWLPLALTAACLVVALLLLWAVLAHGGGRTDRVVSVDEPEGSIAVSASFAETALVHALEHRRDVAAVHVAAFRVRRRPALRVRVRVTSGASPAPVVAAASEAVRGLDLLLGTDLPVLVEVSGGGVVRRGSDSRVA